MGCNCKKDKGFEIEEKSDFSKLSNKEKGKLVVHYFFKTLGFLIGVALLPLINIAIIWFMFNTIVLTKEVNVIKLFNSLIKNKLDDDDDDDYDELTEDDVDMVDVDVITEKY